MPTHSRTSMNGAPVVADSAKQDGVQTVYSGASEFHDIAVERRDGMIELRFSGRSQGWTDEATRSAVAPAVLDYLQIPLAISPDPVDLLVIGLGGGVLPRRLHALYEGVNVDVVELDPEVVRVCEEYFGMPEDDRLAVMVEDGRAYLECTEKRYDAIMIDAFCVSPTAGYAVPFVFVTTEFFALLKSRLKPGGAVAFNVVGVAQGSGSAPLKRFCRGIRDTFDGWQLLVVSSSKSKVPRRRNFVVVACDHPLSAEELRSVIRSKGNGRIKLSEFDSYADDIVENPFSWRGIRAYSDADAPPDGLMRG